MAWAEAFSACMADEGWTTVIEADGGVTNEYSDAQADAFQAANKMCTEKTGSTPREVTEADFEVMYAALLELQDCIKDAGYSLAAPPSYQAFRDAGGGWSPYLDLVVVDQEEWDALQATCPQPVLH